jgi:hypothetical protein
MSIARGLIDSDIGHFVFVTLCARMQFSGRLISCLRADEFAVAYFNPSDASTLSLADVTALCGEFRGVNRNFCKRTARKNFRKTNDFK